MSLNHDNRTPTMAVVGAGPIGLETALYGRFLGFDVTVFEQGTICEHVRQWSHVRMFSPFEMNCSRLGLAAIEAQYPDFEFMDSTAEPTGRDWIERYLQPLADTDLLSGNIQTLTKVIAAGRPFLQKTECVGLPQRNESGFRLLVDSAGSEFYHEFDYLIDATGTFGVPRYFGSGGLPALGELEVRAANQTDATHFCNTRLSFSIPEFDGKLVGNSKFLVIGQGYSAAMNIVRLGDCMDARNQGKVVWLINEKTSTAGPIPIVEGDPLPSRDKLVKCANKIALTHPAFEILQASVRAVRTREGKEPGFQVEFEGEEGAAGRSEEFDYLLANVGFRGDNDWLQELQIHRCYASESPMKWAISMQSTNGADCMSQRESAEDVLRTTEPNFFVVGSKLYGRDSRFLFSLGLKQVRDVFRQITDRPEQDLYKTIRFSSQSSAKLAGYTS